MAQPMMDRREWLRNAALLLTGGVAVDSLGIFAKLGAPRRKFWQGAEFAPWEPSDADWDAWKPPAPRFRLNGWVGEFTDRDYRSHLKWTKGLASHVHELGTNH